MARWFATFIGEKVVHLMFVISVVKAAPDVTKLCSSYINIEQLSTNSDDSEIGGVKRSAGVGNSTGELPPTTLAATNHEIQPTNHHSPLVRRQPLSPKFQTVVKMTENNSKIKMKGESGAANAVANLLETTTSAINTVLVDTRVVNSTAVPFTDQHRSGNWSSPVDPAFTKDQENLDQALTAKEKKHARKLENESEHNHKGKQEEGGDRHKKDYHKNDTGQYDKEQQTKKHSDEKSGKKIKHSKGNKKIMNRKLKEKGRKVAKFANGQHTKGRRTKGGHKVHKKNEYHKKYEFYDEHHEGDGKHGRRSIFNKTHQKYGEKKHQKRQHNSEHKKPHESITEGHKKEHKLKHISDHVLEKEKDTKHGHQEK